jgi:hypothetical protein
MQVDGQRIHCHDFPSLAPHKFGKIGSKIVGVGDPAPPRLLVPVHTEACPIVEIPGDDIASRERHEPKRVPTEVQERLAGLVGG